MQPHAMSFVVGMVKISVTCLMGFLKFYFSNFAIRLFFEDFRYGLFKFIIPVPELGAWLEDFMARNSLMVTHRGEMRSV